MVLATFGVRLHVLSLVGRRVRTGSENSQSSSMQQYVSESLEWFDV
jgi:hypothetical protein